MKTYIKYLITGFFLLIGITQASAQLVLNQYNNQSEISAPNSIILTNGFHVPAGQTVRIFTTGVSYVNCQPYLSTASNNQNYISTKIFKQGGIDPNKLNERNICDVNETIQYFDGLGRPLQTVQVKGSPGFNDLVQPFAYDAFGREDKKYLLYAATGTNGSYRSGALNEQLNFYTVSGSQSGEQMNNGIVRIPTPFSQTVFEASPLNRVQEQGAPGDAWQPVANSNTGHTMKIEYGTNIEGEVRLWTINPNGAFTDVKYYNPGKLYKTTTKDENWTSGNAGTTDEFKDFEGRVVLKRVWETDVKSLKTCYLYDDFGNLRYVMPPAVTAGTDRLYGEITSFDESQIEFLDYMYGYHYDGRKRLIRKKIPGKGWEEMIYNPLDQVVFTQDSIQRQQSERAYVKYDAIGRVIMTGVEYGHDGLRDDVQATVNSLSPFWDSRDNGSGNLHGYNNASAPSYLPNLRPDVINYYDDYAIPGLPKNESASYSKMIKGLLVAQKVRVLGTDVFLWTVNYYDDEGRVVKTHKQHYLSGIYNVANYDDITNSYSFVGELISSTRIHHANGVATTIADRYEYDHVGRPIATFQKINDQTEVALAHQIYNELGQLKEKKLNNDKQSTSLAYNERGWMTGSSSNEFSINLKYNDGTVPQFNGNIANQVYNNGESGNTFTYNYDKLNRLTKGEVSPTLMSEVITYDVMGNITSLNRDNASPRTYHYNGNKLYFAEYVTNGYVYDANGNATTDGRNGMVLSYNYLNLPTAASNANMSLSYTYDATGRRLKKTANGAVRNYIDGIEYNTDGTIDFIKTEAGIARKSGSAYVYEYNLTDHLGNVRYSFNQDGAKLQQDDYYAFGMKRNTFASGVKNKYLYNGKEVQEELGEEYDYGARFYDPVIARWNVVDPLAIKYLSLTPYNYTTNNPIRFIDPDGREVEGVTKDDAKKALADIQSMFSGDKFAGFRNLLSLDKKGKKFNSINSDAMIKALDGIELSEDERTLVDMVSNTINSGDKHKIEYANMGDNLSDFGSTTINEGMKGALSGIIEKNGGLPSSIASAFGGAGITTKTKDGTYSLLISGGSAGTDYLNSKTGQYGTNPAGRAATTGHELFGHGRSLSLGRTTTQHMDAIRTENLILRMIGKGDIQRDGTGHAQGTKITSPSLLPGFK